MTYPSRDQHQGQLDFIWDCV